MCCSKISEKRIQTGSTRPLLEPTSSSWSNYVYLQHPFLDIQLNSLWWCSTLTSDLSVKLIGLGILITDHLPHLISSLGPSENTCLSSEKEELITSNECWRVELLLINNRPVFSSSTEKSKLFPLSESIIDIYPFIVIKSMLIYVLNMQSSESTIIK